MKTDLTFHEIDPGLATDLTTLASLLEMSNPDTEWRSLRPVLSTVTTLDQVLLSFKIRAEVCLQDEWVGESRALRRVLALCAELRQELRAYPAAKEDSNQEAA